MYAIRSYYVKVPDIHLHYYGKEPRPGRKLGHITVWGSNELKALAVENMLGA